MFCLCKPILCLHINGFCCPCLESEEDHLTRIAELSLTTVSIKWYRRMITNPGSGEDKGWFSGDGVLQCGSIQNTTDNALRVGNDLNQPELSCYVGIDATLDVFDTSNGPAVFITSKEYKFVDDDSSLSEDKYDKISGVKPAVMQKCIPLYKIGSVSSGTDNDWNDFGVEDFHVSGVVLRDNRGKKLLIFNVGQGSKQRSLTRNEVVQHLSTLVSWDRKRTAINESNSVEATNTAGNSAQSYKSLQ